MVYFRRCTVLKVSRAKGKQYFVELVFPFSLFSLIRKAAAKFKTPRGFIRRRVFPPHLQRFDVFIRLKVIDSLYAMVIFASRKVSVYRLRGTARLYDGNFIREIRTSFRGRRREFFLSR